MQVLNGVEEAPISWSGTVNALFVRSSTTNTVPDGPASDRIVRRDPDRVGNVWSISIAMTRS